LCFGPAYMTRGAWPPCHRGILGAHQGRLCPWRSGAQEGKYPFKKGSISRVVVMPCSSCTLHALPSSGPLDGARRCSLGGNASEPSPLAVPSSESPRSEWGCRSCLLLAAVRGAQPHGGRCSSAIARLQGFSSCSPAAVPHQWSSRRMTTSLVVGRSKSGCGLPPTLSFKDVHHPRWGGGRAKSGPCPPWGLVICFFLQHSEAEDVHQPCGGGEPRLRGAGWPQVVSCSVSGPLGWVASAPPPTLPPVVWPGRGCPSTARATVAPCAGPPHPQLLLPAGRTRGLYKTSYAVGVAPRSWMVLSSLPWEDGSEDPFVRAKAAAADRCRGGRCCRC
jgi:hypothetical protein